MMTNRARRHWIVVAKIASISALLAQLTYGPKW
jgi:hypothetical protein